jgi:3-(3-hydroxy-phenyl)propionate hydroxylase
VRGQAGERVLGSYDTERRPHARKIIRLALLLGALVMPQNRAAAFAVHGLMSLLRLLPAGRALFEDLKVKPQNTFDEGLFWRVRGRERLRAGAMLPQGWVRPAAGGGPILSDDALGLQWALIGFGVDASAALPAELLKRWQAAGGRVWQWCQRSQGQHLAQIAERLEALDEALLPRRVPLGWVAVVRPDRCVLAEGPASGAEAMLRRALELLAPPAAAFTAFPNPIQEIRHAA